MDGADCDGAFRRLMDALAAEQKAAAERVFSADFMFLSAAELRRLEEVLATADTDGG